MFSARQVFVFIISTADLKLDNSLNGYVNSFSAAALLCKKYQVLHKSDYIFRSGLLKIKHSKETMVSILFFGSSGGVTRSQ